MPDIHVRPSLEYPAATIRYEDHHWPGVVGKNGVIEAEQKKEGDSATPLGRFALGTVYIRTGKMHGLRSSLLIAPIFPDLVWCDDPSSPLYNQPVRTSLTPLPPGVSREALWRHMDDDSVYDIVVDILYNRGPVTPGAGSAIFMHVARDQRYPANKPTEGCVALDKQHLIKLLGLVQPNSHIHIHKEPLPGEHQ